MMNKQYFLQKVLPAISPAQFTYLMPEEKKPANLDKVSVRREGESQTITVDLASLFFKKCRNENVSSKNWVFQFFSVCVKFRTDKPGGLYGLIDAKGSGCPDYISLFNRGDYESQPIANNGLVSLTDPSPCGLISATGNLDMRVQLLVRIDDENDEEDEDLKLSLTDLFWNCSSPLYNKNFGCFENVVIKTADGSVKLYYIVLDNPVEATVDIFLSSRDSFYGFGKIIAYYGDLESYFRPSDNNQGLNFAALKCGTEEAEYCKTTLFEASQFHPVRIIDGKVPLTRSKLVVPNGGSLVIEAGLEDSSLGHKIVKGTCDLKSKPCGCSTSLVSMMTLKVDWKTP